MFEVGNLISFIPKKFDLSVFNLQNPVVFAGSIIFLVFLLILTMAQLRRHYVNWSLKGGLFGIFFGFLLALILEGFLLISGKTFLTEALGWKNAPKPISVALDAGRGKLIQVLGIKDQIPVSMASGNATFDTAVGVFQSLNPVEAKKIKNLICTP